MKLGADLNRVRQQVIQLLHGYQGKEAKIAHAALRSGKAGRGKRKLAESCAGRPISMDSRLLAIEQRVGAGPDMSDLDREIAQRPPCQGSCHRCPGLRDGRGAATGKELIADKAVRQTEWAAAHPDLSSLAEGSGRTTQVERLRGQRANRRLGPTGPPAGRHRTAGRQDGTAWPAACGPVPPLQRGSQGGRGARGGRGGRGGHGGRMPGPGWLCVRAIVSPGSLRPHFGRPRL